MFDRENVIGLLLLALCAAAAGVLLFGIGTGTRWEYTGPGWLSVVLAVLFFGAILYGVLTRPGGRGFFNRSGRQWPDPETGRRRRWPWSRGEDDHRS